MSRLHSRLARLMVLDILLTLGRTRIAQDQAYLASIAERTNEVYSVLPGTDAVNLVATSSHLFSGTTNNSTQETCLPNSIRVEIEDPPVNLEAAESQEHLTQHAEVSSVSAYGNIAVTGHATAFLGNISGNVYVNTNAPSLPTLWSSYLCRSRPRVERHNRLFTGYTLETITFFNETDSAASQGASSKTELTWRRKEDIGEGVFGEVHREECLVDNVVISRAVKILRLRQLRCMKVNYKKEIGALLRLSQPQYVRCFVELFAWYQTSFTVHIAMEYVRHGDLTKHMNKGLSRRDAQQICYQVLDGIKVLHELDIIHRDIKSSNIFVVQYEPYWWVKIGDFSIAKSTLTDLTTLQTVVGTAGYQAPEILGFVASGKASCYDEKCDAWSVGCVLFEVCTGSKLFGSLSDLQSFCQDEPSTSLLPDIDDELAAFLVSLLQSSPMSRPSAEEALEIGHKWFQISPTSNAIDQQECTQAVSQEQTWSKMLPKQLYETVTTLDSGRCDNITTQEAVEVSLIEQYRPRECIDPDVADIICLLVPCSPAAMSSIQATRLTAPQHILEAGDQKRSTSADTKYIPGRLFGSPQIALRLSSAIKSRSEGFKFGRNPRLYDILLTDDPANTIVSNAHFTIFFDAQGKLMIEDCSTNGTVLNDRLLRPISQERGSLPKPRKELHNGDSVWVLLQDGKELLEFSVRIPERSHYQDIHQKRLERYLQAQAVDH